MDDCLPLGIHQTHVPVKNALVKTGMKRYPPIGFASSASGLGAPSEATEVGSPSNTFADG